MARFCFCRLLSGCEAYDCIAKKNRIIKFYTTKIKNFIDPYNIAQFFKQY